MLCWFSNFLTSRSSLRSQHISQSHLSLDVSLTFECFIRLWMLFWLMNLTSRSSLLNAILIYETPYFTELASLAKYFLITLVVQCFSHFRILYSFKAAILIYSITLVVGCFSYFRMIYSFLHAILIFESPYFTELASLATYFSITLVIGCFTYFRMLHSSLDAILAYESYFTELAFKCYSHLRNSLLHGARFARKIFFNHTCRSMLLSLSDSLFV